MAKSIFSPHFQLKSLWLLPTSYTEAGYRVPPVFEFSKALDTLDFFFLKYSSLKFQTPFSPGFPPTSGHPSISFVGCSSSAQSLNVTSSECSSTVSFLIPNLLIRLSHILPGFDCFPYTQDSHICPAHLSPLRFRLLLPIAHRTFPLRYFTGS